MRDPPKLLYRPFANSFIYFGSKQDPIGNDKPSNTYSPFLRSFEKRQGQKRKYKADGESIRRNGTEKMSEREGS